MADTIANPVIKITADTSGLSSGIGVAQKQITGFSASTAASGSAMDTLTGKFEKLSRVVRGIGQVSIAMRELARETESSGSKVEDVVNKIQNVALAVGPFAGPKGILIALAVAGIGEAVKFVSGEMSAGAKAQEEWARSMEKTAKAVEATRKPIESLIATVERQVETFGMSREALEMFDLSKTPAATDRDKTRLEIAQAQRRQLEEGVKMQEMAQARAEQAAKIAESVRDEQRKENEQMIRDAEEAVAKLQQPGHGAAEFSTPSILGFGSAGAFGKISELTNMRQEEVKQTELLKEAVAKLKEIVAKVAGNGPDTSLVIAQF